MTRGFRGSSLSWPGVIVGVLAGAVMTNGCKKAGSSVAETSPPSDMAGAGADEDSAYEEAASEAAEAPADLDELEHQLAGYEESLLQAGVSLPEPVRAVRLEAGRDATPATSFDTSNRCTRVCDIATAICGLADQICSLASDHEGETRYVAACERATLDCKHAETACEDCDG